MSKTFKIYSQVVKERKQETPKTISARGEPLTTKLPVSTMREVSKRTRIGPNIVLQKTVWWIAVILALVALISTIIIVSEEHKTNLNRTPTLKTAGTHIAGHHFFS